MSAITRASPLKSTRAATLGALAGSLLLAGGCASLPGQSSSISALAPRAIAMNFSAAGRVAARDTGDARRGFSGGFAWTHTPAADVIELLTPIGQIAARMTMTAAGAEIELADGRRTSTADPEQFLTDTLGATLPVAALPYWMQAVPLARITYRAESDAIGRPVTLWQNGWEIQYAAYADDTPASHPTRLQLTQGTIEARMIISEWSPK